MSSVAEILERIKRNKLDWEQLNKDRARKDIEHQIRMAQNRIDFWTNAEKEYRNSTLYCDSYSLIRHAKHARKQAQSDLEYWKDQLTKIAA